MKIVLDTELPNGTSHNYKKSDAETASFPASALLNINGVKGIYHVMNFMAVERISNVAWESILADVQAVFNEEQSEQTEATEEIDDSYGEVYVHVQTYKDIPLQVKVFDSESEERFGLSERFVQAMEKVHGREVENYILLRKWADYGIRYGEKAEIGETVSQEIEAAYSEERLLAIIRRRMKDKVKVSNVEEKFHWRSSQLINGKLDSSYLIKFLTPTCRMHRFLNGHWTMKRCQLDDSQRSILV